MNGTNATSITEDHGKHFLPVRNGTRTLLHYGYVG